MFEIMQNRNVLFGEGATKKIGDILVSTGIKKVFILTYCAQFSGLATMLSMIENEGIDFYICDTVQGEPDLTAIDQIVELIRENNLENAKKVIDKVKEIITDVNTPTSLRQYICDKDFQIDSAVKTINDATGHIKCNPRPMTDQAIYEVISKLM